MFANIGSLELLIANDATATKDEKERAISFLKGESSSNPLDENNITAVVGFEEAARMLGYKNRLAVYALVKNGMLRGFYSGAKGKRASGVLKSSIVELLKKQKEGK